MPDLTIGRLRGGFSVSWIESGKRRRFQLTAHDRKEAEAEARDVYLEKTSRPQGWTVSEIWDTYVEWLGDKPTAKTMFYTGKAIKPHFGYLRPDQITDVDCDDYVAARLDQGRKIGSIHTELGHLRSALNWARKKRKIEFVPDIKQPPKPDNDVKPLTDDQIRRIIENCRAPHAKLAVILLLTTGARVSAILDRTWDKIDFERGIIDLRLTDGVTRKGRAVVPMNALARTALTAAHEARLTNWVVEYNGRPIKSIRRAYASALDRAGLSGIRIHQIRHTVAIRMLSSGQPIEKVSQYLGHSNTQITYKTYARFMPDHMADAAEVLNFDLTGVR